MNDFITGPQLAEKGIAGAAVAGVVALLKKVFRFSGRTTQVVAGVISLATAYSMYHPRSYDEALITIFNGAVIWAVATSGDQVINYKKEGQL